jgi:hypothetical protein
MTLCPSVSLSLEAEDYEELPRVARLWPELAAVPFGRVVAQALEVAPLHRAGVGTFLVDPG